MEGGTESQGRRDGSESSELGLGLAFGIGIGGSFQISPPTSPPPPPAASSFYDRASHPFASSAFGSMGTEIGGFSQWQELQQQQALIYKHFMASTTVPAVAGNHELLSGAAITTHHELALGKKPAGGGDPELGRCRRTDGKKWRCSRDAAPGHKYCERHVHRGRPARSRKPVEVPKAKPAVATSSSTWTKIAAAAEDRMLKLPAQNVDPCHNPRFVDVNLDWNSMFRHGMCFRREVSNPLATPRHHNCHRFDGALASNFSDLNDHCFPFMSSELSGMEEDASMAGRRELLPRSFIDAWSNQNPIPSATGYNASSFSAAAVEDDDAEHTQMSLRFGGGDDSPFGGGPLAEVLHHTSSAAAGNERSCGALRLSAAASSPSGVLPKAAPVMVSHSESSGSSSPTFSAASVPSETAAVQWLVQRRK